MWGWDQITYSEFSLIKECLESVNVLTEVCGSSGCDAHTVLVSIYWHSRRKLLKKCISRHQYKNIEQDICKIIQTELTHTSRLLKRHLLQDQNMKQGGLDMHSSLDTDDHVLYPRTYHFAPRDTGRPSRNSSADISWHDVHSCHCRRLQTLCCPKGPADYDMKLLQPQSSKNWQHLRIWCEWAPLK